MDPTSGMLVLTKTASGVAHPRGYDEYTTKTSSSQHKDPSRSADACPLGKGGTGRFMGVAGIAGGCSGTFWGGFQGGKRAADQAER